MLKKLFLPVLAGCLIILSASTLLGQSSQVKQVLKAIERLEVEHGFKK